MVILETVSKDVFDDMGSRWQWLMHMTNCNTVRSRGFAALVPQRMGAWADAYAKRPAIGRRNATSSPSSPGTIEIYRSGQDRGQDNDRLNVVCAMGMWAPGPPGKWSRSYQALPNGLQDTAEQREKWFAACLRSLDANMLSVAGVEDIKDAPVVAVPWGIGCGLAGGNWEAYERMLQEAKTRFLVYKIE